MSRDGPGDIRVFIRWHDQTVFAGEEVRCTLTFKNVARTHHASASGSSKPPPHQSRLVNPDNRAPPSNAQNRIKSPSALVPPPSSRGHRSSLSLTVPSTPAASRGRSGSIPWAPQGLQDARPGNGRRGGHGHKRSISIVSIGSTGTVDDGQSSPGSAKSQRPARGHSRATSLQMSPRGTLMSGLRSASHTHRPFTAQPSPLFNSTYQPDRSSAPQNSGGPATVPNTPGVEAPTASSRSGPNPLLDFRFPMSPSSTESQDAHAKQGEDGVVSPNAGGDPQSLPVRPKGPVPAITEHPVSPPPAPRILSTTSIAGTPRSSGEFYSLSNNSSETLASEYVTQQPLRGQGRPPHTRRTSNFSSQSSVRLPETLMMGYAQVQGTFTLDGSLVDLGPFEQVKRKAVVGGQGGGVVGIDTSKRDSGLLRTFGWGSFTSSIGELLGGNELSSIREMRGIANSKSIPLLSTPQTILFVNLNLAPGESKSYDYSFRLPWGLPPTHRGRAMKISYSLVIGTQRSGGVKEQQVKSIEIPFRVLGSVNSYGEILGHDLMSPYILLRDEARVQAKTRPRHSVPVVPAREWAPATPPSSMNSFLSYVDELLERPRDAPGGVLSPTAVPSSSQTTSTILDDQPVAPPTAKEAIDMAVLRSNMTGDGQQALNRFEIARNGRRLGVVMLARPAYRLGEVVTMAVDFSGAELACYAVHAALETTERVDPSLALRSEASVHRVTRKVHVSSSEAALFARRVVFSPTIPVSATPEFVTSGVSLEWKIRLEFVVPVQDEGDSDGAGRDEQPDDDDDDNGGKGGGHGRTQRQQQRQRAVSGSPHPLLEEISRDDRGGLVLVAAENLVCESFEVAVPLRVYGAVCTGLERLERDAALEEGLVV